MEITKVSYIYSILLRRVLETVHVFYYIKYQQFIKQKKPSDLEGFIKIEVENTGLEPVTSTLPVSHSSQMS